MSRPSGVILDGPPPGVSALGVPAEIYETISSLSNSPVVEIYEADNLVGSYSSNPISETPILAIRPFRAEPNPITPQDQRSDLEKLREQASDLGLDDEVLQSILNGGSTSLCGTQTCGDNPSFIVLPPNCCDSVPSFGPNTFAPTPTAYPLLFRPSADTQCSPSNSQMNVPITTPIKPDKNSLPSKDGCGNVVPEVTPPGNLIIEDLPISGEIDTPIIIETNLNPTDTNPGVDPVPVFENCLECSVETPDCWTLTLSGWGDNCGDTGVINCSLFNGVWQLRRVQSFANISGSTVGQPETDSSPNCKWEYRDSNIILCFYHYSVDNEWRLLTAAQICGTPGLFDGIVWFNSSAITGNANVELAAATTISGVCGAPPGVSGPLTIVPGC